MRLNRSFKLEGIALILAIWINRESTSYKDEKSRHSRAKKTSEIKKHINSRLENQPAIDMP